MRVCERARNVRTHKVRVQLVSGLIMIVIVNDRASTSKASGSIKITAAHLLHRLYDIAWKCSVQTTNWTFMNHFREWYSMLQKKEKTVQQQGMPHNGGGDGNANNEIESNMGSEAIIY